mgnify:CR=1 FL=1
MQGKKFYPKNWKFFLNKKKILRVTVAGLGILIFKMPVLAKGIELVPKDENSLIRPVPKTTFQKGKALVWSLMGLSVYYDPTASLAKKYSAAGRLGCCTLALITGALADVYPAGSVTKAALATCCTASWATYTGFAFKDVRDHIIGNE